MTDEAGYLLAPQQEWAIDGLARRPIDDTPPAHGVARAVGGALRVQLVVRPTAVLSVPELTARLRALVARHAVLRLRLLQRPGARRPMQHLVEGAPDDPVAAGLLAIEATTDVDDICRREWQRPFDLGAEAPLRVVRSGEAGDARLVLTASAVALDGRGLVDLAAQLCTDETRTPSPDPLDWLGATAFFRESLEDVDDEEARADREHFTRFDGQLTAWPRAADLPTGKADWAGFERIPVPVAAGVAAQMVAAARTVDVPAESLWLAGLQALLARTNDGSRPVVRVSSDGRGMEELETLLGPLSRWLPVAPPVDFIASVSDLAVALARDVATAREHEHGYREPDLAALHSPDSARTERDAIAFARIDTGLGGAGTIETLRWAGVDAPLILLVAGTPDAVELALEVDSDRVDLTVARSFAASLTTWLAAIAREPNAPIRAHDLVAPAATHQPALNGSATTPPPLFLERFAAAARAEPERAAVVADAATVTYGELDHQTKALAARLRASGAGPRRPVAVVMSRTHHAIVAMLGAMRAGAPYMPLDPALPMDALRFRLDDAHASVVLTEALLAGRIPDGRPRWLLDTKEAKTQAAPERDTEAPLPAPASLAYLLYTSGSTGTPKAVAIEHRQLAAYIAAVEPKVGVGTGARWGNLSTLAADLGHTTLFPALASGGTVRLLGEESMGNARILAEHLRAFPVDVLKIVPSHLAALLDGAGDRDSERAILPRRTLVCGGEALSPALVERVAAAGTPELKVLNHYGPTEATVGVAVGDALSMPPPADADGAVPIGLPMGSARLYVLDRFLARVPDGVVGELFIAGPTVARGYHGRAALTAERFLPDPFAPREPGARMYRTGDRARRLQDGSLVFVGRTDHQVKIRGFRVEPGEIEAVIAAHEGVAQAAVRPVGDLAAGAVRLVAWVAPRAGAHLDTADLRNWVKPRLAVYMRPAAWVVMRALPLTANGKIDRAALPEPDESRPELENTFVAPRGAAERDIAAMWCELLQLERVGVEDNFFDLGGHSLLLVQLMSRLEARFDRPILITELFRHPTVAAMARWLGDAVNPDARRATRPAARWVPRSREGGDAAIAVVGMAARLPGAPSIDAFWDHLRAGRDGVQHFSRDELLAAGVDAALLDDPRFVPAGPVLADIDRFDAGFFGIPPRQAQIMDPQHRLLLETAWTALEHAGIAPGPAAGRVGVYAGAGVGSYFLRNLASSPALLAGVGATAVRHANRIDNLAVRVAYHLDLAGPAVTVQSGCSSSLVAVHLAAQALRAGDADVALAGGVTVDAGQGRGYRFQPGGINAPDGRCRAFDQNAAGTVFGSGVGAVVLKRLSDAIADGDTVHAVMLGSAINNDGALKPGFTAPSVEGQAAVVAEALERAGVAPADIDFVEAHGTGTSIGDPVEVAALTRAFGGAEAPRGTCALGSVKSSVGHLDAAAGIAGFLKAVLAISHGEVPPTLHFEAPNPRLGLDRSPFRIASELQPIAGPPAERRAGVSSFGIGGTNVHVVLGGPPAAPPAPMEPTATSDGATILLLAARSETALDRLTDDLGRHLAARPDQPLADVAWTLAAGRRLGPYRRAVVCADREAALRALSGQAPDRVRTRSATLHDADIAFLFPGQGAQVPGMAAQLHLADAAFRAAFEQALEAIEAGLANVAAGGQVAAPAPEPGALRSLLLDPEAPDGATRLADTRLAQPALFVVEWALAEAWAARGVRPVAMLGHSLGELVAATRAGVFALADAASLVALRGALLAAQPAGAMLAVRASADEVEAWLAETGAAHAVHLSAINGAADVTVGGEPTAIDAFARRLESTGIAHTRLATSHAFHVPQMQEAVAPFLEAVGAVERHAPKTPFVSVRTGTWIRDDEAVDPQHWAAQLVEPVRFAAALAALGERCDGAAALEVGPGRALAALVRREAKLPVVASLPAGATAAPHPLSNALAELWLHGAALDWEQALPSGRGRRVPLPTYPFARERHWVDPSPDALRALRAAAPGVGGTGTGALPPVEHRNDQGPGGAPTSERPPRSTAYIAPRTDLERLLVDLWEQVLGIPEIGVHDDFFELGGDSVQGLQVLTLVRQAGYVLDPTDLFERTTIAALAEVLRPAGEATAPAAPTDDAAMQSATPRRIIPWTAEQRRWLAAGGAPVRVAWLEVDPGTADADSPRRDVPDEATLRDATAACTARHGALRLRTARAGGEPIQRLVAADRALWLVTSRDAAGRTPNEVTAELAQELDPEAGPVAAAVRVRTADGPWSLAILVHPLVADEASLSVLVNDLLRASRGDALEPNGADPQAVHFAHYAETALLAALDDSSTSPATTSGRVPRDQPLGEARAHDRAIVCRDLGNTEVALADLLAATAAALGRWTGLDRVAVAVETHTYRSGDRKVGCFAARRSVELALRDGRAEPAAARAALEVTATDRPDALAAGDKLPDVLVRQSAPAVPIAAAGWQRRAFEGTAPWTRDDAQRPHAIEIELRAGTDTVAPRLLIEFSTAVHRTPTIEALAVNIAAGLAAAPLAAAGGASHAKAAIDATVLPGTVSAAAIRPADLERLLDMVQSSGDETTAEETT
ncbi:MAG: amino acid adenylation domain-containing protein [Planctomycetota bacterium]